MTHKSLRKFARKLLVRALQREEFPWDYSYFKWQDMPVEVRRELIRESSHWGRTWIHGRTSVLMDVHKYQARRIYNENWDHCRDLWKENYRRKKLFQDIDRPIKPRNPKAVKWERQRRERQKTERAEFYRLQQECYQTWLRLKKPPVLLIARH